MKCRAWDIKNKEYFNVVALGFISNEACGNDRARIIGSECVLEWSIGKPDKNNMDVYEGDLLQTYYDDGITKGDIIHLFYENMMLRAQSNRGIFPAFFYHIEDSDIIGHIHQ